MKLLADCVFCFWQIRRVIIAFVFSFFSTGHWIGGSLDNLQVHRNNGRCWFLQTISSGEVLPRLQNRLVPPNSAAGHSTAWVVKYLRYMTSSGTVQWGVQVILSSFWAARVAQCWEHSPPTNVARVRIPASTPHVGWFCCWSSPFPREVFLRVLRFSPFLKNQHFQIPYSVVNEVGLGDNSRTRDVNKR